MKKNQSTKKAPHQLERLSPKCAGIDIGASEVFVCVATSLSTNKSIVVKSKLRFH